MQILVKNHGVIPQKIWRDVVTVENIAGSAGEVATAVNNIAQGATVQVEDTQNASQSIKTSGHLLTDMIRVLQELGRSWVPCPSSRDASRDA